jgi:prepilin signal peptidase PulO-like enzyme (type II secretory pathway)
MTLAVIVLLGLAVGSFLNVVIARLPEGRTIWGRSACPRCGVMIAPHDNIPLLSFALLRGQCRGCGVPIPWRYPLVEGGTAAAFAAAYVRFGGPNLEFLTATAFLSALIAISVIDLLHQLIPDVISLPGIVAGFIAAVGTRRLSWVESLAGIVMCGGLLLAVIMASRGGMGGGDMKLGAMLGAFLGWQLGLFAMLVAVVLGGAVAAGLLLARRKGRKDAIPFGPFLALGGAVALLLGAPPFLMGG